MYRASRSPAARQPQRRASYVRFFWRALTMAVAAGREGRLTWSLSRWLLDLRHLHGLMRGDPRGASSQATSPTLDSLNACRQRETMDARSELDRFIAAGQRLRLPAPNAPVVSIVIVLFNRAELTFRCLQSIVAATGTLCEVILVDNASTDDTAALLDLVDGATVRRLEQNTGYLEGCNIGAAAARGAYLLLLNSDAQVTPDAVSAAVAAASESDAIGAVGGRLVLPDGVLQEAGSIVWSDGSCLGYGRGDNPDAPPYSFVRDVDFCSAAFLLTPRALFQRLGGFDRAFVPGYYEDVDYCTRLWQTGYRVVYDPAVVVRHYEFASAAASGHALRSQLDRRAVFAAKHGRWLQRQHHPGPGATLRARTHGPERPRVLIFDDRVPHSRLGSGLPRALELVRSLIDLGWHVTLFPLWIVDESWSEVYDELPRTVEVMLGQPATALPAFLSERTGYYDALLVSRSHNLGRLRAALGDPAAWCPGAMLVFDAEAVQAQRRILRRRATGQSVSDDELRGAIQEELQDLSGMHAVLTVSRMEEKLLAGLPVPVHLVTYPATPVPSSREFNDRQGLLFVGAFGPESPSTDAVLWFFSAVLPLVTSRIGGVSFTVAGHAPPREIRALSRKGVRVLADARDLHPIYEEARVVVAPTRFAAGIPLKVLHAAAHGVPVVCTTLLAAQLGWNPGTEILAADTANAFAEACVRLHSDAHEWERVRVAAIQRLQRDHSPASFRRAVASCFEPALTRLTTASGHTG